MDNAHQNEERQRRRMNFSLRKSFKSNNSFKHVRRFSSGGGAEIDTSFSHESIPFMPMVDHNGSDDQESSTGSGGGHNEVIVKVDPGDSSSDNSSADCVGTVQRQPTLGFVQNGHVMMEDPPSKLISQFLDKQKTFGGGEISLDMDLETAELEGGLDHQGGAATHGRNLPPCPESPLTKRPSREFRVSFEPSFSGSSTEAALESVRRRCKNDSQQLKQEERRDEALKCTANASFRRQLTPLSRLKTKSRLLDPSPDEIERMSGLIPKSGQIKSGLLGRVMDDDEDEDPLEDLDFPDKYKREKLSTLTVLQWLSLIMIVVALVCSLSIPSMKKVKFVHLELWKWEVLMLVLICGRLVSGWGIRLIVFFIERNFMLRKRVLYFVYGLRKGVQNCWWLGLVLLAWHFLFDDKVKSNSTNTDILRYVTKILVCFLVGNFIWLIKTLIVKVLASSFHVSKYFDRIQEALFNQFVIEALSGPPVIAIQRAEDDVERTAAEVSKLQNAGATMPPELKAAVFPPAKSGKVMGNRGAQKSFKAKSFRFSRQFSQKGEKKADDGITIDKLHKFNTKNISAWNMKRLMNIVRYGSLSTLDEQIHGATTEDESATQIRSEYEAKAAARKIFYNVARNGSKYIYLQDLMRFLQEDEALKTMSLFEEASETRRISKTSLKNWVVNAFRERRALALTLNDTKTAVNKLHQMIKVAVGIVIAVISLVILGIATSKFFVVLGSQIVVVSFVFGNTAKTLFESVIFLFVIHPFDVGDRCEIDGEQMIVEEMNILTTLFLRGDNQIIVYHNSILATKSIGNYYRSPDMGDAIEFHIHISTPGEKIAVIKQRVVSCIEHKKEHWYPNPMFILKDVEDLNKLKIAIWLRHRMNHQDMGERYARRAILLEEMVKIFRELDIQYRLHPIDINVRSMPPPEQDYSSV